MTSSQRNEYQTPLPLYKTLDAEFRFEIDLAASAENRLARAYLWGPCLSSPNCACGLCFTGIRDTSVWCNPPYDDLRPWVARFASLAADHNTVVALLQVDPTTRWWATMVESVHELRFTGRRVNFVHPPTCNCEACTKGVAPAGNNKGSVIAIWRPGLRPPAPVVHWGWDWEGVSPP